MKNNTVNKAWRRFALFLIAALLYVTVPYVKEGVNFLLTHSLTYTISFGVLALVWRVWVWALLRECNHRGELVKHEARRHERARAGWRKSSRIIEKLHRKLSRAYEKIKEIGTINRKQREEIKQLKENNDLLRREAMEQQDRARVAEQRLEISAACISEVTEMFKEDIGAPNQIRKYESILLKYYNTVKAVTRLYVSEGDAEVNELVKGLTEETEKEALDRKEGKKAATVLSLACENEDLRKLIGDILHDLQRNVEINEAFQVPEIVQFINKVKQRYEKIKYFNS